MGIAMIAVLDAFTHTKAIHNHVHRPDIRIVSSTIEQVTRLMTHPYKELIRRLQDY